MDRAPAFLHDLPELNALPFAKSPSCQAVSVDYINGYAAAAGGRAAMRKSM